MSPQLRCAPSRPHPSSVSTAKQSSAGSAFPFVFGALFAMHSHLFGQIMDVAPDRLAGRRTTP
jgi:4-hydroxybenzoate polyprenyltransferase